MTIAEKIKKIFGLENDPSVKIKIDINTGSELISIKDAYERRTKERANATMAVMDGVMKVVEDTVKDVLEKQKEGSLCIRQQILREKVTVTGWIEIDLQKPEYDKRCILFDKDDNSFSLGTLGMFTGHFFDDSGNTVTPTHWQYVENIKQPL